MKSDAKRSIRNLIDLGLLFTKSETQKRFFNAAQEVISNPKNAYHFWVKRMIADVNNDTIKKTGLNLGYSSLIYGANKLRNRHAPSDDPLPWLLIFDICGSSAALFDRMKHFITEGRELGIYSYIIVSHKKNDICTICEIAKRFDECLFILAVSPDLISEQTAKVIGDTHNMMVSVQVSGPNFNNRDVRAALLLLKQKRCLYGFDIGYDDSNMEQITASEYIRSAISLGNIFGMYIPKDNASNRCKAEVFEFVCRERGSNGQPLIGLEWLQDMRYISKSILSGEGYMTINLADIEYRKAKDTLTNSLLETLKTLKGLRPCTSSEF
jgi:hypothetical protein